MPQRCGICESFTYLAVRQEIHGMYVRMSEWDLECIFLAQSAIGRAKITGENCGGNERRVRKKDSESRTKIREIRIHPSRKSQFSFESQSCSSVGSLITWPRRRMKQILRFTLAKGILRS